MTDKSPIEKLFGEIKLMVQTMDAMTKDMYARQDAITLSLEHAAAAIDELIEAINGLEKRVAKLEFGTVPDRQPPDKPVN